MLKTIGFSSRSVLMLVLAESVLLLLIGGVIGVLIASVLGPKGEKTADPADAVATLVSGLAAGVRAARLAPAE